jgi:hypothetical protein
MQPKTKATLPSMDNQRAEAEETIDGGSVTVEVKQT